MLQLFKEAGYSPRIWLDKLGDMSTEEMMQFVSDAEKAQTKENELAAYMQEAGDQLVNADYQGAMRKYTDVLDVDPDNEEARRGQQEATKGHRLTSMTPEELEAATRGGMSDGSLMEAMGVVEAPEASDSARKFDPVKKLPKREPHYPETPYDLGSKGPTHITVCWHMHKDDVEQIPPLPLPMEHQIQYGISKKLMSKWIDTAWNGDVEGEIIHAANGGGKLKIGVVKRPGRKWTCRIEGLSPGEKYAVRIRSKNARGWSKWSWTSRAIIATLD